MASTPHAEEHRFSRGSTRETLWRVRKRTEEISRLPPPPGRRKQLPHAPSPDPCATPPPTLALACPSARRKYGCQPRRGSQGLLECPLPLARRAPHPTAAPPAPFLPLLQPRRQTPPRSPGLADSVRRPTRWRGFLCRDRQPCRAGLGAEQSIPGCKVQ